MIGRNLAAPQGLLQPDAAGFVLAGGRSSRMGADKALIQLGGQPLIAHSLGILRQAGLSCSIAGGSKALAEFAPLIEDRLSGRGPLGGICAALVSTSSRWAVFLPVDLPFIPASLVACLLVNAQTTGRPVTLASLAGAHQPFPVILSREVLPSLQFELESGRGACLKGFEAAAASLGSAISAIQIEAIWTETGPAETIQTGARLHTGLLSHRHLMPLTQWFSNLNTEADLRRAEQQIASPGPFYPI